MPLHKVSVSPMDSTPTSVPHETNSSPVKVSLSRSSTDRSSSQTSSISSNGFDICRICHCEGDAEVPLIAPCYCSGSLRYVHQACLQQWIKSSNIRCCELCKFQFIMQTKTKPFTEWEHLEMSGMERRKLLCAVLFHAVALTCVIWSLYVLIDRTVDEIRIGSLEWPFWTKLVVVAIGFTGGVVFMYIQCKAYLHICQRWKAYNRVIYVQNAPEKPSLPSSHIPAKPSTADSHIVHIGQDHQSHFTSTAAVPTDSPLRSDARNNEKRSIDLKGVRNLHIFFNEENRIRVQKDEQQPRLVDYLESGEPSIPTNNVSVPPQRNEHETVNTGSGGTSWHIQIEKTTNGKDTPKANDNRVIEEMNPNEGSDNRQYSDDYKVTCNDSSESPVLKLQIKKAEIVIKFGSGSNETSGNTNENGERDNDRTDNSVNIKIKSETGNEESPKLKVSPNVEAKLKNESQQQQDDEGSEDSLSNCVSPTCRLLPESEPIATNTRPKSYPFDKRQSLNSGTWTPSAENTTVLDQDVGSQSPLLAQNKNSEIKMSN